MKKYIPILIFLFTVSGLTFTSVNIGKAHCILCNIEDEDKCGETWLGGTKCWKNIEWDYPRCQWGITTTDECPVLGG